MLRALLGECGFWVSMEEAWLIGGRRGGSVERSGGTCCGGLGGGEWWKDFEGIWGGRPVGVKSPLAISS